MTQPYTLKEKMTQPYKSPVRNHQESWNPPIGNLTPIFSSIKTYPEPIFSCA